MQKIYFKCQHCGRKTSIIYKLYNDTYGCLVCKDIYGGNGEFVRAEDYIKSSDKIYKNDGSGDTVEIIIDDEIDEEFEAYWNTTKLSQTECTQYVQPILIESFKQIAKEAFIAGRNM